MSESAIGLEELPQLEGADVAHHNADLHLLSRRVYRIAGTPLRWVRSADPHPGWQPDDVWLAFRLDGQLFMLRVARSGARAWAGSLDIELADLHDDTLSLLALLRLSPHCPANLQFEAAAFSRQALAASAPGAEADALQPLGVWVGVYPESGECSAHAIQIWGLAEAAVQAFWLAWDGHVLRRDPYPLSRLPIELPLVAARWHVDAATCVDLAVGDVLIID